MKYKRTLFIIIIAVLFHAQVFAEGEQAQPTEEFLKYKALVSQCDAEAQFKLAEYYRHGIYVPKDNVKEAELYEKAALQGYVKAQAALANCYELGIGVYKSTERALYWRQRAAEQGDPDSQYFLGRAYYDGEGKIRDYREAAKWITMAAKNGSAFGRGFLGIMHIEGKAVNKDLIKAYAWLNIVSDWRMYKERRDELEIKMRPNEVIEAQKLSKQLIEKYGKKKN